MSAPIVTVLLSSHNGERYLSQALASMSAQSYSDWEWVLVDNASSDGTAAIMASYRERWPDRVRVVRNPDKLDLADSLNRGLEIARGDFIARMDDDDVSDPSRLEQQVAWMRTDSELLLTGTPTYRVDEDSGLVDVFMRALDPVRTRISLCWHNPFVHASVMYRRMDLDGQPVRYPVDYSHAEDYALWARLALKGRVCVMPRILLTYRKRRGGMTGTRRDVQVESTRRVSAWYTRELTDASGISALHPDELQVLVDAPGTPDAERLLRLTELFDLAARAPWIRAGERELAWMAWARPCLDEVAWRSLAHGAMRCLWLGAGWRRALGYALSRCAGS